eukprot:TRINITY_DN57435_c0_g1_i1.p1 TRINITY_DN57435_c0_g1~~TRINITY_DN57435_c0_g1_i1.p1  ORF type:complete len:629 (+),score=114.68 TRINITY_DN57435_c0_g1_i1:64-1887(+)
MSSGQAVRHQSFFRLGACLRTSRRAVSILDRLLEAYSQRAESPEVFLEELEWAARASKIKEADRSYRSNFSANYKALFASSPRWYRPEVWEAYLNFEEHIVVNGEHYDLSSSTCHKSGELALSVGTLVGMLNSWARSSILSATPRVKSVLQHFNDAFFEFEKSYIMDLMSVEKQALKPLLTAISLEKDLGVQEERYASCSRPQAARLEIPCARARAPAMQLLSDAQSPLAKQRLHSHAESPCSRLRQLSGASSSRLDSPGDVSPCSRQRSTSGEMPQIATASQRNMQPIRQCKPDQNQMHRIATSACSRSKFRSTRSVLEKLLAQISNLNACVNVEGRGREDMTIEVLEAAADAFSISDSVTERGSNCDQAFEAARRHLASNILCSFADLRNYFATAGENVTRLDPQLRNNIALVQHLAAWEDSWELGARFLVKPELLEGLCHVAAQTAGAQRDVPEFASLLKDQDAELFLILPRLVLLCGLAVPAHFALTANFLPHHFQQSVSGKEDVSTFSKGMSELVEAFEQVNAMLGASETCNEKVLIHSAILGAGQGHRASGRNDADETVNCFMLRLEGFSMELQRHEPESWNRCCFVLMQCIEAASSAFGH